MNRARRLFASLFPILLVLATLAACAGVLALAGQNPLLAGKALVLGAVGSKARIAESLSKTIPLIFTGIGVALSFRAGFWNIGAEGQFLIGALCATGLATKSGAPLPLVLAGGALGGALWALLAGVLKTARSAPEIIVTIMLNYIALRCIEFSLQLPSGNSSSGEARGWLLERAAAQPQSDVFPTRAQLPLLLSGTSLHAGLILALACAPLCWWFLFRTERGFLIRACGQGVLAARAAGIRVEREVLWCVALSGACCGLGGACEISGATRQLGVENFNYGYTAIAVALLAGNNPLWVVPSALLFGMMASGGGAMERSANVPAVAVSMMTGVLVCLFAILPRTRLAEKPR